MERKLRETERQKELLAQQQLQKQLLLQQQQQQQQQLLMQQHQQSGGGYMGYENAGYGGQNYMPPGFSNRAGPIIGGNSSLGVGYSQVKHMHSALCLRCSLIVNLLTKCTTCTMQEYSLVLTVVILLFFLLFLFH